MLESKEKKEKKITSIRVKTRTAASKFYFHFILTGISQLILEVTVLGYIVYKLQQRVYWAGSRQTQFIVLKLIYRGGSANNLLEELLIYVALFFLI